MLAGLVTAVVIITGLYFSPYLRNLTDKKILKSVFHIIGILVILLGPMLVIFPLLGVPVYVSSFTGRFLFLLGFPTLIFVGVRKFKNRKKI